MQTYFYFRNWLWDLNCLEIGKITNLTYKGGPFFKANRLRREKDTSCNSVSFQILQTFLKKLRFWQVSIVQLAEQPQVMICKHLDVCLGSNPSASSLIWNFINNLIIQSTKHAVCKYLSVFKLIDRQLFGKANTCCNIHHPLSVTAQQSRHFRRSNAEFVHHRTKVRWTIQDILWRT